MSEIDLSFPLWSATIHHTNPKTDGVWDRVFNSPVDDEGTAVKKAVALFIDDGLSHMLIYRIEVAPLLSLEGGELNGD